MDKGRSWKKREGYIFGGFGLLAGFVACNKSKNNFIRHGGPVFGGLLGYRTGLIQSLKQVVRSFKGLVSASAKMDCNHV